MKMADDKHGNKEKPNGHRDGQQLNTSNRGHDKDKLVEQELIDVLTEGQIEAEDPNQNARQILPPKYEIRIQASWDPIVEETLTYRRMAKEVDDRYDKYLKNAEQNRNDSQE